MTTKVTSESDLFARFTAILIEQLGVDESAITEQAHIERDLGADELDMVEIAMLCEDELGITLDDDDVDKADTVGKFRTLLKSTIGI